MLGDIAVNKTTSRYILVISALYQLSYDCHMLYVNIEGTGSMYLGKAGDKQGKPFAANI